MAQKYPQDEFVRHAIHLALPVDPGDAGPPGVMLTLKGRAVGPEPVYVALTVGEAHALGLDLVEVVAGLLAGQRRPWDEDPGRTPFHSRSRSSTGGASRSVPAPVAGAPRARRRAPVDGYPRPRRSVRGPEQAPGS